MPMHAYAVMVNELDTLEVRQGFVWILINNYKMMESTVISQSCKMATNEFINTNNPILEFIESNIQQGVQGRYSARICIMPMSTIVQRAGNVKPIPNVHFCKLMLFNDFEKAIGTGNKAYYKNCAIEGLPFYQRKEHF